MNYVYPVLVRILSGLNRVQLGFTYMTLIKFRSSRKIDKLISIHLMLTLINNIVEL